MYKITFQIEGATPVVMEANEGDNPLELARRGNVAIDAPCSGNGSCGKCRVKPPFPAGGKRSFPAHFTRGVSGGLAAGVWLQGDGDAEILAPDIASALPEPDEDGGLVFTGRGGTVHSHSKARCAGSGDCL
ncbi:MAG: 2Fe-2S iron-sulfur cluster-binding protein [Oscillospiraceae bacterium]